MKLIRRAALAAALLMLGMLVAGAVAQTKFPTRLTLKDDRSAAGDLISGAVRSKAHACERNRKLRLHHRAVTEQTPSTVIAKLRTNSKGKWKFRPKKNENGDRYATPGYYRAKVGEVKLDGGITCKERTTSSLYIG